MTVQAVILAAGHGRRMRPLSDSCHKALLPVGPTTILGRILDGLGAAGVETVTIVTGYRAPDVRQYVASHYPDLDVHYIHNERASQTNNIVSLSLALADLPVRSGILLIECDLLVNPALFADLIADPAENVALLDSYQPGMDGTVVAVQGGVVTQVYLADTQTADFSYTGTYKTLNIYKFGWEFCQQTLRPLAEVYSQQVDASCYYELILAMLTNIPRHRISAHIVSTHDWIEVDDPNDLAAARFKFDPASRAAVLDDAYGGHWSFGILDFAFMRNMYFPTPAMWAELRYALPELATSYGSAQRILDQKLAYVLECSAERLHVLHGATQVYPLLRQVLAGRRVAIPSPTFGEYARCFPWAATYPDSPEDPRPLTEVVPEAEVVVVVNPNSPTGRLSAGEDLRRLILQRPETLFVVDESFLPFSGEPSLVEWLEGNGAANVLVLASLSKSLGVPGLRLGYLYTPDAALRDALGHELPVWNLGSLSEFLLEILLKFRPALADSLARTRVDRAELRTLLEGLPIVEHVHPSDGNFLLACLRSPADAGGSLAADIRGRLLTDELIEVKDVTDRFPDRRPRLRIAVRTPADNRRLVSALSRVPAPSAARR